MEQRLIDANALHYHMGVNQNDKQIFYITGEDIDAAPTIGPENLRPNGKWVKEPFSSRCVCTNCKMTLPEWIGIFNYCPYCGAKMCDRWRAWFSRSWASIHKQGMEAIERKRENDIQ